jgi:hypothetical protein
MKRGPVRNLKSPPAKKRPRNKSDNNAMTATAEEVEVEVEVEDSDNAKKLESSSAPVVTMRSRKSDDTKEVSIGEIYSL